MSEELAQGTLVCHRAMAEWGPGKVVARSGTEVWVYFRDYEKQKPEERVKRFSLPTEVLQLLDCQSDEVLDRLPPYRDGVGFQRAKTSLTLEAARKSFLGYFPRGFADPGYESHERNYKWAAHERFQTLLKPKARDWIANKSRQDLLTALTQVYWPGEKDVTPLNLMSPQFEWPAYKEAIEEGNALLNYVEAALDFTEKSDPDDETFSRYAENLTRLPTRKDGVQLEKWTVLTWLPFIGNPNHHMFVKPSMTQEFASLLPFDIQYRTELNPLTYRRIQEMSRQLRKWISDPEINPEQRELDMIDLHSFMWVVTKYAA